MGAITLISVFSFATARVSQIGENLRNSPIQGAQEIIKEIKPFLQNGDNFIFEENLGWMLRYYLFGEKYRNLHYDFGDENMQNMKSILLQEPYTNFYLLLYRPKYSDIVPINKILSPEYRVEEIIRNNRDNFRFYKIVPVSPNFFPDHKNYLRNGGKNGKLGGMKSLSESGPKLKI